MRPGDVDLGATYFIGGSVLKELLQRPKYVKGTQGEIDSVDQPDGGVIVRLAGKTFVVCIVNGEEAWFYVNLQPCAPPDFV